MSATATLPLNTPVAQTAAAESKGCLLPCPHCGETDASITLNLADGESFTCLECENDFTAADVRSFIARWTRLLTWLDGMPQS